MKRIITAVLCAAMLLMLASCGGSKADYVFLDETLGTETYAIGFRLADKELCDKVYGTLKEMKADGKLAEISTKWFGKDVTTVA